MRGATKEPDKRSEPAQLAAVQRNGYAINFIKNPSEPIQLAAVKQNSYAIQYIKDPNELVQLAAIRENCAAIQHIPSPNLKVLCLALARAVPERRDFYINLCITKIRKLQSR